MGKKHKYQQASIKTESRTPMPTGSTRSIHQVLGQPTEAPTLTSLQPEIPDLTVPNPESKAQVNSILEQGTSPAPNPQQLTIQEEIAQHINTFFKPAQAKLQKGDTPIPTAEKVLENCNPAYHKELLRILTENNKKDIGRVCYALSTKLATILKGIKDWEFKLLIQLIQNVTIQEQQNTKSLTSSNTTVNPVSLSQEQWYANILRITQNQLLLNLPNEVLSFAAIETMEEADVDKLIDGVYQKGAKEKIDAITAMASKRNANFLLSIDEIIDFTLLVNFTTPNYYGLFAYDFPPRLRLRPFEDIIKVAQCAQNWNKWQKAIYSFAAMPPEWDIDHVIELMNGSNMFSNEYSTIVELVKAAPKRLANKPDTVIELLKLSWDMTALIKIVQSFEQTSPSEETLLKLCKLSLLKNRYEIIDCLIKTLEKNKLERISEMIPLLKKAEGLEALVNLCKSSTHFLTLLETWPLTDIANVFNEMCLTPTTDSDMIYIFDLTATYTLLPPNVKMAVMACKSYSPNWSEVYKYYNIFLTHFAGTLSTSQIEFTNQSCKVLIKPDRIVHIAAGHTFEYIDYATAMRRDDFDKYSDGQQISFFQPGTPLIPTITTLIQESDFLKDVENHTRTEEHHSFRTSSGYFIAYKTTGSKTAYITTIYPLKNAVIIFGNTVLAIGTLQGKL
ncbi:hypothetical protein [Parabacteroides faecis]|uniref:Uncharacterized protein n=1 Tax=Parabacteroides faecis TaxID=1217282 RepID=A0ABR6KMX4_9BACT|nr:hypothetical protein [Parabacteroides faecis]MBB4622766.1 hypothetical protein [Parabacteroides faecis]